MNPKAYVFIGMGFELIGAVLVLLWLGGKLDAEFDLKGFGAMGGIVIALVGWITHLLFLVRSVPEVAKGDNSSET